VLGLGGLVVGWLGGWVLLVGGQEDGWLGGPFSELGEKGFCDRLLWLLTVNELFALSVCLLVSAVVSFITCCFVVVVAARVAWS
jgi:hypothetical protein